MRRFISSILFLFFLHYLGFASNSDSTLNIIFKNIYNQEFDLAELLLDKEGQHLNEF